MGIKTFQDTILGSSFMTQGTFTSKGGEDPLSNIRDQSKCRIGVEGIDSIRELKSIKRKD